MGVYTCEYFGQYQNLLDLVYDLQVAWLRGRFPKDHTCVSGEFPSLGFLLEGVGVNGGMSQS